MDQTFPQSPTDVLLFPGIVLLFGLLVYGGGLVNGLRTLETPKYRWVGVGLIAFSTILGFLTMKQLFGSTGEFYRAMIGNRKVLFAHYVGFIAPLVLLAAVPVAEVWSKRAHQDLR